MTEGFSRQEFLIVKVIVRSTAVKRLSMREKLRGDQFLISFRRVSSVLNLFLNLKFAEYSCFSVVLASSLHFPKKILFFILFVRLF